MSSTTGTRIFGIKVTLDPKIIIGALVVVAGILFWYNSGSEDSGTAPAATTAIPSTIPTAPMSATRPTTAQRRAGGPANERGTLRLRPIDATRGDVDPTLRLDLLRRLSSIQPTRATRSLFEVGTIAPTLNPGLEKVKGPIIKVTNPTLTSSPYGPGQEAMKLVPNIPFKYYGYVKPSTPNATNRGLFLDGDNVLVASEGETVKGYLVVELTPNSARLEDINLKQGQTLPVVPVAAQ